MTRLQAFTYEELRALADALTQYAENYNDEGATADETARLNPHLADAERLLREVEVATLARLGM